MRRIPPLNSLRAFEAAARHLSFTQAAEELGVTPTAISHQIKLLEDTIGKSLFRRHPRPMTLTETGERLIPTVQKSFDSLAQVVSDVIDAEQKPLLRISTTAAFASNVLLPKLADWAQRYPGIELEVHASDLPVDLAANTIDVAIRYAKEPSDDLCWTKLCSDEFVPMASRELVHETKSEQLQSEEIFRYPLISYKWKKTHPAEPSWEKWRNHATSLGKNYTCIANAKMIRLSEESHALEAAAAGQGIVLASNVIAGWQCSAGKLRRLSDVALPGLTYYLVHKRKLEGDERLIYLEDWLRGILIN